MTRRFAKGRTVRREPGAMNGWERRYAAHLEAQRLSGEVLWFSFDAVKFRLAEKTFYTPDFLVMKSSGDMEVHEVKGHWEDDARVKIKVAADKFPFKFVGVSIQAREWVYEEF